MIWDTAGSEKYRPMITSYFNKAKAAIFVFALDDPNSLLDIKHWLKMVKKQCGSEIVKVLVGNKCDLDYFEPDEEQISEYCKEHSMEFIKSSAMNNINIKEIFQTVANLFCKKYQTETATPYPVQTEINSRTFPLNNKLKTESKKKCC